MPLLHCRHLNFSRKTTPSFSPNHCVFFYNTLRPEKYRKRRQTKAAGAPFRKYISGLYLLIYSNPSSTPLVLIPSSSSACQVEFPSPSSSFQPLLRPSSKKLRVGKKNKRKNNKGEGDKDGEKRADDMEKGDSPSPAPSNQGNGNHIDQTEDAILHDGFQQLIQHNNASTTPTPLSARTPTPSSYPEQQQHPSRHHQPQSDDYHYHPHQQQSSSHQYSVDLHGYMGSDPHSRYSSPALESRLAVPGLADDEFNTSPPLTHSPYPQQASHPHSYPGAGLYQHGGYQIDPSPYPQLPDIGSSTVCLSRFFFHILTAILGGEGDSYLGCFLIPCIL